MFKDSEAFIIKYWHLLASWEWGCTGAIISKIQTSHQPRGFFCRFMDNVSVHILHKTLNIFAVFFTPRAVVCKTVVRGGYCGWDHGNRRDSLKKPIIIPVSLQMKGGLSGGHFHNRVVRNPSAPLPGWELALFSISPGNTGESVGREYRNMQMTFCQIILRARGNISNPVTVSSPLAVFLAEISPEDIWYPIMKILKQEHRRLTLSFPLLLLLTKKSCTVTGEDDWGWTQNWGYFSSLWSSWSASTINTWVLEILRQGYVIVLLPASSPYFTQPWQASDLPKDRWPILHSGP